MVPRWVRGHESGEIVDPPRHSLEILGLGGTIATPPGGIEADVLPVTSFDDLRARSKPMRAGASSCSTSPYTNYSETVTLSHRRRAHRCALRRGRGAGPVGRSDRAANDAHRQRGVWSGPATDSGRSHRRRGRQPHRPSDVEAGRKVRVRLVTSGMTHPDVESANVIAEIRGRERPDEIVLIGAHLDSWDVGTGASDDGAGCIVTWEAAAPDEGARAPAASHRSPRAVGKRGARPARRQCVRGALSGARGQARLRARGGLGRVRAGGARFSRQ